MAMSSAFKRNICRTEGKKQENINQSSAFHGVLSAEHNKSTRSRLWKRQSMF